MELRRLIPYKDKTRQILTVGSIYARDFQLNNIILSHHSNGSISILIDSSKRT